MENPIRTAIVGAGISGLAAAQSLSRDDVNSVTVFDAAPAPGGVLQTIYDRDFIIETSADMFVTDPNAAVQLCEQLGISDQLIAPSETNRFSSIVRHGNLIRTPAGFSLLAPNRVGSVLASPLLSPSGKLRFLMEYFVRPRKPDTDESLRSFAIRHYGQEVFERMVQPLVAGIYSADAEKLSISATLKRFVQMEKEYGSLIRAARAESKNRQIEQQSSGARYGMFLTPRQGFSSIIESLVRQLSKVDFQMSSPVDQLEKSGEKWHLTANGQKLEFDQIVLATSAKASARLLMNVDRPFSQTISEINFGSMIVIAITCNGSNFSNGVPQGFGFVVPDIENRKIIACSFSSNKFQGRAPTDSHLMRVFIGGQFVQQAGEMSDSELMKIAERELQELIGFTVDDQVKFRVHRWMNCMPQYEVGHLERLQRIESHLVHHKGLQLAGNSYRGVGIPACIQSGWDAAKQLAK